MSLLVPAFILSATTLHAGIVTVPDDLGIGDEYRLMFVTSTRGVATSTSIGTYNNFVNAAADAVPALTDIDWTVIGSTSSVHARDNTNTNPGTWTGVPIYRLDGVRLANDNADLWDGSVLATPNVNELGESSSRRAFTGTTASGTRGTYFLGASQAWGGAISTGDPAYTSSRWIEYGVQGAGQDGPFYAMSETLIKIPEPASAASLLAAALTIAIAVRQRRRTG